MKNEKEEIVQIDIENLSEGHKILLEALFHAMLKEGKAIAFPDTVGHHSVIIENETSYLALNRAFFIRPSMQYSREYRVHLSDELEQSNQTYEYFSFHPDLGCGDFGGVFSLTYVIKLDAYGFINQVSSTDRKVVKLFTELDDNDVIAVYDEFLALKILCEKRSLRPERDHAPLKVHYLCLGEDCRAIVMPRAFGQTLLSLADNISAIDIGSRCLFVYQLLSKLCRIHRQGYIHRDLKPDNIHIDIDIDEAGILSILDLGCAYNLDNGKQCQAFELKGARAYYPLSVRAQLKDSVEGLDCEVKLDCSFDSFGAACCMAILLGYQDPSDLYYQVPRYMGDTHFNQSDFNVRSVKAHCKLRVPDLSAAERKQLTGPNQVIQNLISQKSGPYTPQDAMDDLKPFFAHFGVEQTAEADEVLDLVS